MNPQSLLDFHARFHQAWHNSHQCDAIAPREEASPAASGEHQLGSHWQLHVRSDVASFDNLSKALELEVNSELAQFYGRFYGGNMAFAADFGSGELLQAWNEDDFGFLQENLIGHAMMKKKLKQPPTWFLAPMEDSDAILVLDNSDATVWLEVPGKEPHQKVADSLDALLSAIEPKVLMPEPMPASVPQPGLWQRLKTMGRHLLGKS